MPDNQKMPSLFLSHGAPTMAIEPSRTQTFIKGLGASLPKPKAILLVSAHWETAEPMLTAHPKPSMIYDFYGFPEEMYRLDYPAQGSPELARAAGFMVELARLDPSRGLDHGAWVPLMLAYPEAEIPVVQLSVQPHKDAAHHYKIGQQLSDLREQGVMIIASGNTTHNLRAAMRREYNGTPAMVTKFSEWLHRTLALGDHALAQEWLKAAPDALWNHPTPEHFLPLFTALGAAGEGSSAKRIHQDVDFNVLAMDAYRFS